MIPVGILTAAATSNFVGILDLYPNASVGYSLRKLRNAYTGNCIQVRRSSDNALLNIGFSNNVLDTITLLTFIGVANGFVSIWYDQSGNSRDIAQTTTAMQPQIVTAGVVNLQGTKPTLTFNGTTQFLTRTDAGLPVGNATYITLTRTFANPLTYYVFLFYGQQIPTASVTLLYGPVTNASSQTSIGVTNYGESFGQISRSPNLYNLQFVLKPSSYGLWYQYINNSLSTNVTFEANTALSGTFTIGNGLGYYFSGNMQETIIYPVQQTIDRTGIESNINTFYTIY